MNSLLFLFHANMLLCLSLCGLLCRGRPSLFTCHCITGVETGVSFDVFQAFADFFFLFFYLVIFLLDTAHGPLKLSRSSHKCSHPEWVTAPGMSKSLMGSRQTHIWEMTFTQKVTIRNCSATSHRACHCIYLIP